MGIILLLGMLLTSITLIGFCADVVNLYKMKSILRRATEAGVLAGAARFRLATNDQIKDQIVPAIIEYNAQKAGIALTSTPIVGLYPTASLTPTRVGAQVTARVNSMFLRWLPFGAVDHDITIVEFAKRPIRAVEFVVDCSSSMAEYASGTSGNTKLQETQLSLRTAIRGFTQGRDFAGIICFSATAQTYEALPLRSLVYSDFDTAVDNLHTMSATDMQSGIIMARRAFQSVTLSNDSIRAIILVSDGAPNQSIDNGLLVNPYNPGAPTCDSMPSVPPYWLLALDEEFHYLRAIREMDQARQFEHVVSYVIGAGNPSWPSPPPSPLDHDPYQNMLDYLNRHDFFLARVANDRAAAYPYPTNPDQFRDNCVPTYAQHNSQGDVPEGYYYALVRFGELRGAFRTIINSLSERLEAVT